MNEQDKASSTLMHRWFEEVWNKGRLEAIDEMMDADCIAYGITDDEGNPVQGPEGFKPYVIKFRQSFPDIRITIEDILVKGDKVAARCRVRGTHAGDGLGIAATQKPIDFTGMCIGRIAGGKIVEAWNNFDFMGMYQQVGLLTSTKS
jgi:predicted ester cyclase